MTNYNVTDTTANARLETVTGAGGKLCQNVTTLYSLESVLCLMASGVRTINPAKARSMLSDFYNSAIQS